MSPLDNIGVGSSEILRVSANYGLSQRRLYIDMSSEQANLWRDRGVSRVVSRQVAIIHRKSVRYIEYEITVQDISCMYGTA